MSGAIMGQANALAGDHPDMACFGLLYIQQQVSQHEARL